MTEPTDGGLRTLQHEVQRLLGQCLLRLQAYEHLMKAIVAERDISGPVPSPGKVRATRAANQGSKTLGTLVNQLLESYLTTEEQTGSPHPMESDPPFRIKVQLILSEDDFARTETGLKELVRLRNNLVHHFLAQHDLQSLDGCRAAEDALIAASSRIKLHWDDLRQWAEGMMQTRQRVVDALNTDAFRDFFVFGTVP